MEGVIEGRIVHYVLEDGEHRPAIIVKVWPEHDPVDHPGEANLVVFMDGTNDKKPDRHDLLTAWVTSVCYNEKKEEGTYHWPERA